MIRLARRSNRGFFLVLIGFVLLLIAFTGNPQVVFAKVVNYLSGGKIGSGSTTGSNGQAPATVQNTSVVLPKNVRSTLNPGQINDNITTGVQNGQTTYQVPASDLNGWNGFVHWVQTHDPFFNSGVAKTGG